MTRVGEIWLPDGEQHLLALAADYQGDKRDAALRWVKAWRTAIDVGAHCGLWARHLVSRFVAVHAFEPVAENGECFGRNVPAANAYLYACALGSGSGRVGMGKVPGSSADSAITGTGDIPMHRLDDFDLQEVDFLKVDCVGYELEVLRGARETLERCRPCVSVEQKVGYPERFGLPARGAVRFLEELGAQLRGEKNGVYVLSWA